MTTKRNLFSGVADAAFEFIVNRAVGFERVERNVNIDLRRRERERERS